MSNVTKTIEETTKLVITPEVQERAKELLVVHGLDFNISKRKLIDEQNNDSGYFGLWNDQLGVCIHTVKADYHVSQNKDILEVALMGIAPFGEKLRVTKAGCINQGRKVYLQVAIAGDNVVGNDIVERFITIIDSNDGSVSLSVGIGDLTMSCQNQFYRFYSSGNKMRHTASLEKKLKELPKMIESALAQSMLQMGVYREMVDYEITPESQIVDKLVKHLLGYDRYYTSTTDLAEKSTRAINKMDALYNAIYCELADKGWNLWGLHSGTTRFTTFDNKAPKRENGRTESLMIGGGYKLNQQSLEFAYNVMGKELPNAKTIAE